MVKILSIISILLSIAIGIALIAQKWGKQFLNGGDGKKFGSLSSQ